MSVPAIIPSAAATQAACAPAQPATPKDSEGFFGKAFHEFLDIVNPLQHLPVIGTLYRAITGDTEDTVAKIAGGTLYGGLWGAVSAVADSAFEAVTGKDFGATVLAFAEDTLGISHHDAPVQVAADSAPRPAPRAGASGAEAFGNALAAKGIDGALATRALYAYRRSQGLIPASLN
jgi:hypothetical protein